MSAITLRRMAAYLRAHGVDAWADYIAALPPNGEAARAFERSQAEIGHPDPFRPRTDRGLFMRRYGLPEIEPNELTLKVLVALEGLECGEPALGPDDALSPAGIVARALGSSHERYAGFLLGNVRTMAKSIEIPTIDLPAGTAIPQFGLGVFQVPPKDTVENVTTAIEIGYRHIDTAKAYGNEAQVGQAVRASGLPREAFFITTKLWNNDHGDAVGALKQSLGRLEMEHVDLYLIHWPVPAQDRYVEAWQGLIEAQKQGLTREIGVSNFQAPHLRRIIDETGVVPAVNQIELHPLLAQAGLRREHADRGIVTEAWSPLAQGAALTEPAVEEIAAEHGRTPAQVVLRWHVQLGNVVFPKSMTPSRLEENIDIWDFELSDEELDRIEALDRGHRTGPDPDKFS